MPSSSSPLRFAFHEETNARKSKKFVDEEERKLKKHERAAILLEDETANFALEEARIKNKGNKPNKPRAIRAINDAPVSKVEEKLVQEAAIAAAEKRRMRNRNKSARRLAKEEAREAALRAEAKESKRVPCGDASTLPERNANHDAFLGNAHFKQRFRLEGCGGGEGGGEEEGSVGSTEDEEGLGGGRLDKIREASQEEEEEEEEQPDKNAFKEESRSADLAGSPVSVVLGDLLQALPLLDLDGTLGGALGLDGASLSSAPAPPPPPPDACTKALPTAEIGREEEIEEEEDEEEGAGGEEEEEEEGEAAHGQEKSRGHWKPKKVSKKQQKRLGKKEPSTSAGKEGLCGEGRGAKSAAMQQRSGTKNRHNESGDQVVSKSEEKKKAKATAKARYEAFESKVVVELEEKEPNLRRRVYRDQAAALWQRSPENPDNPMHALFLAHEQAGL